MTGQARGAVRNASSRTVALTFGSRHRAVDNRHRSGHGSAVGHHASDPLCAYSAADRAPPAPPAKPGSDDAVSKASNGDNEDLAANVRHVRMDANVSYGAHGYKVHVVD